MVIFHPNISLLHLILFVSMRGIRKNKISTWRGRIVFEIIEVNGKGQAEVKNIINTFVHKIFTFETLALRFVLLITMGIQKIHAKFECIRTIRSVWLLWICFSIFDVHFLKMAALKNPYIFRLQLSVTFLFFKVEPSFLDTIIFKYCRLIKCI